jgi:hypothetical protein
MACGFDSQKAVVISMSRLLISKHDSNCSKSWDIYHTTTSTVGESIQSTNLAHLLTNRDISQPKVHLIM